MPKTVKWPLVLMPSKPTVVNRWVSARRNTLNSAANVGTTYLLIESAPETKTPKLLLKTTNNSIKLTNLFVEACWSCSTIQSTSFPQTKSKCRSTPTCQWLQPFNGKNCTWNCASLGLAAIQNSCETSSSPSLVGSMFTSISQSKRATWRWNEVIKPTLRSQTSRKLRYRPYTRVKKLGRHWLANAACRSALSFQKHAKSSTGPVQSCGSIWLATLWT